MVRLLSILLATLAGVMLIAAEPPPVLWTPANAVLIALADAQAQSPLVQPYLRYLDLGELPETERVRAVQVLSGHVNALSREPEIVRPAEVGAGRLLRLNIKDYGWDAVWDRLADADPYFHARVVQIEDAEVEEEYGFWTLGGQAVSRGTAGAVWKTTEVRKVRKPGAGKKIIKGAAAPWLSAKAMAELIALTQSKAPIVSGAWFFQQTAISFNRTPNYYDFLGIKDQKTFEKLVGFDEKESRKFSNIWREAVSRSGVIVGRRPRRIERLRSLGGGLWRSLDSKVTRDKSNPLRVLDDALTFDVSEQLAHGANGMMIWFLGSNKGERQDVAPDFIASDQQGAANDSRVHINLNCIRCHAASGIKEFQPWARTLFQPPRALEAADYDQLQELRIQYLRHLEPHLEDDRRTYARAIAEATGLAPEKWARDYYSLWEYYVDAEVDLNWAARTLGTTPARFQAALAHQKKSTGQIDAVLATFLAPPALTIGIESWEEAYPIAQEYLAKVPK